MPIHHFINKYFEHSQTSLLSGFDAALRTQLDAYFKQQVHGRTNEWNEVIQNLPKDKALSAVLNTGCLEIGAAAELDIDSKTSLKMLLKQLMPWRKGPFNFFDIIIDTEWRSDWKWSRVQPHISNLKNRKVLDIGCGNGYHLFRMIGEGASLALGIDPTRLFLYQFHVAQHFLPDNNAYLLPLRCEHLPAFSSFDSVFSLGVLYHRRSPVDHLTELLSFLRPGGELILETLVIDGDVNTIMVPPDRYAKMANIWFLPSTLALENLLAKAGFRNIRTVDVNQTSTQEQRATEWMTFHSLADFLDPNDPTLTAEGLPAPKRALIIAEKP